MLTPEFRGKSQAASIPAVDEREGLLHRLVFIQQIIHDYLTRAAGELARPSVKLTLSKINRSRLAAFLRGFRGDQLHSEFAMGKLNLTRANELGFRTKIAGRRANPPVNSKYYT